MLLDTLLKFEWYNDPLEVNLSDLGMKVTSVAQTDFCNSHKNNISKNNGHFFFSKCEHNFIATVKWGFANLPEYCQCGIMVRVDNENWIKASVMSNIDGTLFIRVESSSFGKSDLSTHSLSSKTNSLFYQLEANNGEFILSYSPDEMHFYKLRVLEMFQYKGECEVGAYICNPTQNNFSALLSGIDIN